MKYHSQEKKVTDFRRQKAQRMESLQGKAQSIINEL